MVHFFSLLRLFIAGGAFWILLAISMYILSQLAFGMGMNQDKFKPKWAFLLLQGVALIIMNSIYLAVVINFATQCELILFYVNEVRFRLEEKSVNLKDAMQVTI